MAPHARRNVAELANPKVQQVTAPRPDSLLSAQDLATVERGSEVLNALDGVPIENLGPPDWFQVLRSSLHPMSSLISALLATRSSVCRSRAALQIEIQARRHQLAVLHRSTRKRPRLTPADRMLWAWLSRV